MSLIACAAACVTLATREAHACRAEALPGSDPAMSFDVCAAYGVNFVITTVAVGLAVPSLATDVGIIAWYARTRTVPIAWPIVGTALWFAHTGLATASLAISIRANDNHVLPVSIGYVAVSASSLVLSVAALFSPRPFVPATRVAIAPWRTREGAGLSLGGAF